MADKERTLRGPMTSVPVSRFPLPLGVLGVFDLSAELAPPTTDVIIGLDKLAERGLLCVGRTGFAVPTPLSEDMEIPEAGGVVISAVPFEVDEASSDDIFGEMICLF